MERVSALIATLTTEPEKVERGLTIDKIIDHGTPISVLARQAEKRVIKGILDLHLSKLAASFNMNLNLKDYQIAVIVEDLIQEYPNETIEDFIYVFRQARLGAYGDVYRLDSAVVFSWFKTHLDQKYERAEAKLYAEKDNPYQFEVSKDALPIDKAQDYISQWLTNVSSIETKAIPYLTGNEIKEEGGEKPRKSTYKPPSKEYAILRELERQWMRECFNPLTGKPNENHLSFDEWIKKDH
jgi:hypothetical protein